MKGISLKEGATKAVCQESYKLPTTPLVYMILPKMKVLYKKNLRKR